MASATEAGRGPGAHSLVGTVEKPAPRHLALTSARRLKRVFNIGIEQCARCGGQLPVISSIEEPALIARILAHRRERDAKDPPVASSGPRVSPSGMLF